MVGNNRRQFERLSLAKPILALLDGQNALILDIGVSGAFVEHSAVLLFDSDVVENTATTAGGGVYLYIPGTVICSGTSRTAPNQPDDFAC